MTDITGEVVLDARLLEPPEPFVQAMEALRQIQPRQFLAWFDVWTPPPT